MAFDRKEFLSVLNEIKPALAGKSDIVGLDSIWFIEKSIYAYNGVIQIKLPEPFAYAVSGGVPGDVLIKFIASVSDDIELDINKSFNITAGKSHLKLPLLEPNQSVCEFPDIDATEQGEKIVEGFIDALERCLVATSKNSTREAYSGIMIEPASKGVINLFSTDGKSLTWEGIEHPSFDAWEPKLLLPGEFCTQLLRLVDNETFLLSDEGYASVTTGEGISLTTRLLDPEGAPRYANAINKHLGSVSRYYNIPDSLRAAIERCELIKPDRGEDPLTIDIKDGEMNISIKTTLGQAQDQVETDHPDIKIVIDSGLLLRALDNYTEFAITDDAFILHGEGTSYHLISTLQN